MKQEYKKLLLKDLSARLPYGVIVKAIYDKPITREIGLGTLHDFMFDNISDVKPYLRPMSSMTDEEKLHIELTYNFFYHNGVLDNVHIFEAGGVYDRDGNYEPFCEYRQKRHVTIEKVLDFIHWLNAHHFDYRGLIEKGLAIAVTEENNPYEA